MYWTDCCLEGEHIAIRRDRAGAWRAERCGGSERPLSIGPGCIAPCWPGDPNDVATCIAGRCELVNVETQRWDECTTDSDCMLVPRVCDGCYDAFWCSSQAVAIAVASRDEYERAVCSGTLPENCLPRSTSGCTEGRCD